MIYLRADENEAGVTVEDWAGDNVWLHGDGRFGDGIVLTDVQARAVVEGLLRRVCSHEVLVNDNVGNGGKWRCESCGKKAKRRDKETG